MPSYLLIFIVLYVCITVAQLLWVFVHRKERGITWMTECLLILLIPIAGSILALLLAVRRKRMQQKGHTSCFEHLVLKNEVTNKVDRVNKHKEVNIVPLEEALVINDAKLRRQLVLELMKKDLDEKITLLEKAVHNDDTETAHYAASALAAIRRKQLLTLQQLGKQYEQNKNDLTLLTNYAKALKQYLQSGLLDQTMTKHYKKLYAEVLVYCLDLDEQNEEHFVSLIETEIELGNLIKANHYCNRFLQTLPDREQAYVLKLKLLFAQNKRNEMQELIEKMLSSDVRLTHNTRNLIRYWQKGGYDAYTT